jgi:Type IV secretion system pilin
MIDFDKHLVHLAVTLSTGDGDGNVNIPTLSADQVLQNTLNLAYFIAGVVAVIVIIVGGITFATSSGDSAKVTKGKNMVLYSVIGLVVVLAAFAITNFVVGRLN